MTQAHQERLQAAELPAGSVVSVLLEQHAKIRDLFDKTTAAVGDARQQAFDELRELLAVHEAGEEIVVRPVTKDASNGAVAEARNHEEKEAATALAELEKLDVHSAEFAQSLAELEQDVSDHADAEERDEFPFILSTVDQDKQQKMGSRLLKAQKTAPTHPHPTATGSPAAVKATGPFAALLDKARDAFSSSSDD
jgi:hemerythrin-like domain-containing protein